MRRNVYRPSINPAVIKGNADKLYEIRKTINFDIMSFDNGQGIIAAHVYSTPWIHSPSQKARRRLLNSHDRACGQGIIFE